MITDQRKIKNLAVDIAMLITVIREAKKIIPAEEWSTNWTAITKEAISTMERYNCTPDGASLLGE